MTDVKWIKITTDMFDNRKIKYLRRLPDGDSIVLIWVMLLTMAGRCNAGGMIFLAENIPYTPKMLADELDFDESVVELALQALLRLGMVTAYGETLCITNWEEYQNIDKMTEIREYNRLAKQKQREKQKALLDVNDKSMTSQSCQDTDIDIEEDIDKEKDKKDTLLSTGVDARTLAYAEIISLFNEICVDLPKVKAITDERKRNITSAAKVLGDATFEDYFKKVHASNFLCGRDGKWQADFNWVMKKGNVIKVLEGNYDNRETEKERKAREEKEKMQAWLRGELV